MKEILKLKVTLHHLRKPLNIFGVKGDCISFVEEFFVTFGHGGEFVLGVVEDEEFSALGLGEFCGVHGATFEVGFDYNGNNGRTALQTITVFKMSRVKFCSRRIFGDNTS